MADKFKPPDVEENVGCNLIPMIDIMFLLLLFFMLSADMSQRDLEEVVLPQADQVKEDTKVRGTEEQTTVNVFHRLATGGFSCPVYSNAQDCRDLSHWLIAIRGKQFTTDTVKTQLQFEANLSLEDTVDPAAGKKLSKRKLMIRADQAAPYGYVQGLIQAAGEAGIYMIEVGAAAPPKP